MNTYSIHTLTLHTLADAFALDPDREEAERRLTALRARIAEGKAAPEQFLILRSERGVEGIASLAAPAQVPVFPHFRPDVGPGGITVLARAIREHAGLKRKLLLQDSLAPLDAEAVLAAGWVSDAPVQVMYETDLRARAYPLVPGAVEGGDELRQRPEIAALMGALGHSDWEWAEGWTLVALADTAEKPVALGACGPSNRPGWANLNMLGVHLEARGQGYGTRLHAHLLARAAEHFVMHGGSTEAENQPMRRIFEKHGSRHDATQMSFR
ncbi:GNAT family N-acetyltransferase [Deinococcus marmoris]|uniref:GNAT family N-acetyltransferase n=1 Tax=Deinococcus marmoris TaxID=249408 RepID=UPI0004951452|nr:GNAT family N-acetyltransferase [Deinococcus marmoris]